MGNIVTRNDVHRFTLKKEGGSTLGGRDVWFDPDVNRLNYDNRGNYLGEFNSGDLVLVILKNGEYYTSTFDATNHYPENILRIEKFSPHKVWTAILNDADQGYPYLKRFTFEPTSKPQRFLGENEKSSLIELSDDEGARFEIVFGGADSVRPSIEVVAREFVSVKSFKAKGKRLTMFNLAEVRPLEPLPSEELDDNEEETEPDTSDDNQYVIDEKSDDEVRDELTGQQRLF